MKDLKNQLKEWNQTHEVPEKRDEMDALAARKVETEKALVHSEKNKKNDVSDDALFLSAVSDVARGRNAADEEWGADASPKSAEAFAEEATAESSSQVNKDESLFLDAMAVLDKCEKG